MNNKNEKNRRIRDLIIKTILIIIIILLFIQNCALKDENKKTGNKDIFEIKCDNTKCVNLNDGFEVSDKDIVWKSKNELNIFSNPAYNMKSKIAPEDSNAYEFVVKNNTKKNIKYTITFNENNFYNINMKYRLKKDNKYIENNWVSLNELKLKDIDLKKNQSNNYYLEWKWSSSNNDTSVANIKNAYSAEITITAEAGD